MSDYVPGGVECDWCGATWQQESININRITNGWHCSKCLSKKEIIMKMSIKFVVDKFAATYALSPRQKGVLYSYILHGDRKGVAKDLNISMATVNNHILDFNKKAGVNSLPELLTKVIAHTCENFIVQGGVS